MSINCSAIPEHLHCKSCHSKLAPEYPLVSDGLDKYKNLGGK